MPRYLMTWELDQSKIPVDPKERANAWLPMIQMVKQDIQSGRLKDWGTHIGEMKGFGVYEGSEEEAGKMVQKYVPFVQFTTHPIITIDQMEKLAKDMAQ
jgi:hypothetical protein